jgi:hypothetical protein
MKKGKIGKRSIISLIVLLTIMVDVICYVIASNPEHSYIYLDVCVFSILLTVCAVGIIVAILITIIEKPQEEKEEQGKKRKC